MPLDVKTNQYKCLLLLAMIYIATLISALLLAHKFVFFWGYDISAAVLVFPLSFTCADIIAEVYGFSLSKQLLWAGLLAEFFFCFISLFLVHLPGPVNWKGQVAYNTIFNPLSRIYMASFAATLIGGFVNIYIISRWRVILRGRYFWLRSIGAISIGEGVFTLVAAPIIFLGAIPIKEVAMIAFTSYVIKILYACLSSAPATFFVSIVKFVEKIKVENFDDKVSFNPFR